MKAMTIPHTGDPSVLTLAEIDQPQPVGRELLIEVHAAALNPVDTKLRSGKFRALVTFPVIPGFDVSGRVVAIGPEATRFRPGDAVFASPPLFKPGAHAEYVVVDEQIAARKPESLSHVEAAAIPLAFITAWELLIDMAKVQEGQTVLIHAAAGGVGHFAVQLAQARGATVIGTASSDASFTLLDQLGVAHKINYKTENVAERVHEISGEISEGASGGCDAVFDLVGAEVFKSSIELVAPRGCLGTIVGIPADAELNPLFLKSASLHAEFMGSTAMQGGIPAHQTDILKQASTMIADGTLKPHVSQTFPLKDLAAAHELQASGTATGKVVITVKN